MHEKKKNKIGGIFQTLADEIIVTNREKFEATPYINIISDAASKIWTELEREPFARFVTQQDLFSILLHYLYKAFYDSDKSGDGNTLKQIAGIAFEESKLALLDFVENVPHDYTVYFPLPFDLPEGINEIIINDFMNIEVIAPPPENGIMRAISEALSEHYFKAMKGTYLCIKSNGYAGRGEINTSAIIQAYTVYKLFILIAINIDLLTENHDSYPKSISTSGHFSGGYIDSYDNFALPLSAHKFIGSLKLNSAKLKKYKYVANEKSLILGDRVDMTFEEALLEKLEGLKKFLNILQTAPEKVQHITTAIDWAFEARCHANESHRFILSFIAIEALIGEGAKGNNTTETLSDRFASLIGGTRQAREKHKKHFKSAYGVRSELVHGSSASLNAEQRKHLFFAESYFDFLLRKEMDAHLKEFAQEQKKRARTGERYVI